MIIAAIMANTAEGDHTDTEVVLELHRRGAWHQVGRVRIAEPERGIGSPTTFEYDFDYLDRFDEAINARDYRAVSCRYPVGYDLYREARWPAFLLDLLPSGAARRHWEDQLRLRRDDRRDDWTVLARGASHPPGNLRVAGALDSAPIAAEHPGFPRSDVVERAAGFIEYARQSGAPISGSTGAGGDSPKFLLREDLQGRWHADGALADARTKSCWLVKFPRTRDDSDRLILEAEAAYHQVARRCGVRTEGELVWERDCLFVPRFDRVVHQPTGVDRLGLESLCSLSGVADFGVPIPKEQLCAAVAEYVDNLALAGALQELVLRDVLDVALGNSDNHARNTSVLKTVDGRVALAPLYDFAPMILDERGIARVCRWSDNAEFPRWDLVADALEVLGLERATTRAWLRDLGAVVAALPSVMRDCGVPEPVARACAARIATVARALAVVTP
jgi:serine/threonine-protein kinase HipA